MAGAFAGSVPGARGGSGERMPGGRSAYLSDRHLAHLRPGSAGVTPPEGAGGGRSHAHLGGARLPSRRHASPGAARLRRRRHFRLCCHWRPSHCPLVKILRQFWLLWRPKL